jgi:hypothetical protein
MKSLSKVFKVLSNIEIQSALIWAAVILLCSYVVKDQTVSMILITAGGFHSVLLSNYSKKGGQKKESRIVNS